MADVQTLNIENSGSLLAPQAWAADILYANQPNFIFLQLADKPIEANASVVNWAVCGTLNPGGVVGDGTNFTAGTLTLTSLTGSPVEYGNMIVWSRRMDLLSITNMRENPAYKVIRDDYSQTLDAVAYALFVAGTYYVGGGTFGTANPAVWAGTLGAADYKMNTNVILTAVEQLKLRKVPTFDNGRYVGILHVTQMTQLKQNATFTNAQNYAAPSVLIDGDKSTPMAGWAGAFGGMDLIESTQVTTGALTFGTSGTVTAYRGVALGKEALGAGFSIPMEINFDMGYAKEAYRTKSLNWYAFGLVKILKPANALLIRTT